jgi:hypothetical protein
VWSSSQQLNGSRLKNRIEDTVEIQKLVIARAISGLRIKQFFTNDWISQPN